MSNKLSNLITTWPKGTVMTYSYLRELGYGISLLDSYVKHGWIASFARGVYMLSGDTVSWLGALSSLQEQKGVTFVPGGRTALDLLGRGHFIRWRNVAFLYGQNQEYLPRWFLEHAWEEIKIRQVKTNLFPKGYSAGQINHSFNSYSLKISGLERALFELVYHIPNEISFEEAALLFEGILSLDTDLVQNLMENCNSIKVKRLFLFLSELKNLPWFKKLNLGKINLGSGKRIIEKHGKLDNKYLITVPAKLFEEESELKKYLSSEEEI